jgi:hypothetical protein
VYLRVEYEFEYPYPTEEEEPEIRMFDRSSIIEPRRTISFAGYLFGLDGSLIAANVDRPF